MSEILAQVWPSVPGCILFGSILVRHRLTPGRLSMHRELFLVATAFTDDRGSSRGIDGVTAEFPIAADNF